MRQLDDIQEIREHERGREKGGMWGYNYVEKGAKSKRPIIIISKDVFAYPRL